MQWLQEEGCLDHVQFGPGRPASTQTATLSNTFGR
jgi:hypothetical protein